MKEENSNITPEEQKARAVKGKLKDKLSTWTIQRESREELKKMEWKWFLLNF